MALITLLDGQLAFGHVPLLDHTTFSLETQERVGLIGRNGAGKSSLLKILGGLEKPDDGILQVQGNTRISYVAQEPQLDSDATVFEAVSVGLARVRDLIDEYSQGHGDLDAMQSEIESLDGWNWEQRVGETLHRLHLDADARISTLSGGNKKRVALAQALVAAPDVLLLDEPTNHLDLDALVWLEAWLKRYTGTLVMISHDREFLDAITNVTLHIDNAKLVRYGGNYSTFEDMRAEQMLLQQATLAKQQEKIAHLQKFIDRFKAKASKAKQAQSRVKALERMEKIAPVLADAEFTFEFKEPLNLPNPMLSLLGADIGYPPAEDAAPGTPPTVIVRGINRSVHAGQRIGILGANGQGKSTLVKTIARDLAPIAGDLTEGKGLNIGYFAQQELDVLRPEDTPLEHMIRLAKEVIAAGRSGYVAGKEQDLRNFLGTFNFSGDMVKQPVGTMSGGEKARLVLCMIVWQRPNLLLLDEPTNHLDLSTREALSVALNEFEGTVMLVSHDRALLRSVCDEFWLVADGAVGPYDGDLDDYQRYLLDEARRAREAASASRRQVEA